MDINVSTDPLTPPALLAAQPTVVEPPDAPPAPHAEPTVLYGRARLQAEINAATKMPDWQRRGATQTGDARVGAPAAPGKATPEQWWRLFQTEGWQAFKQLLRDREAGYLTRLRNPAASVDEVRTCQGALFELAMLLSEESRLTSLANKTPPELPDKESWIAP